METLGRRAEVISECAREVLNIDAGRESLVMDRVTACYEFLTQTLTRTRHTDRSLAAAREWRKHISRERSVVYAREQSILVMRIY
jgi:hypothetical protein